MAEQEPNIFQVAAMLVGTDIQKGCSSYSRQTDPGNGKTLDMCMDNRRDCPFYEGIYITRGDTQPTGGVSRYDCGIAEGVAVGFCRLQKDAIRLGPILLFDKRIIRPTPKDK